MFTRDIETTTLDIVIVILRSLIIDRLIAKIRLYYVTRFYKVRFEFLTIKRKNLF